MSYRPPLQEDIQLAAQYLARVAHSGQKRSGGRPYIEHAEAVAVIAQDSAPDDQAWLAYTVGWLHDVIEDTTVTAQALRAIGFPHEVVLAVIMLTRGADEPYDHYITRLIELGSDTALVVKLADLTYNLGDIDNSEFDDMKVSRLKMRWLNARGLILAEQNRREAVKQARDWEIDRILGEAA